MLMSHLYNAYCENPFCLFVAETIAAQNPEEAEEIALMRHGHLRKGSFELCREGDFPGPEITVLHDFPCFECIPVEEFYELY